MDGTPATFQPLPGRTVDRSSAYEVLLQDLLRLVGVEPPVVNEQGARSSRIGRHGARRAIGAAVSARSEQHGGAGSVPEEWFAPLMRAAVHEPDPSFVRELVRPAVTAFGRRRVRLALLDYLETGVTADAAGAARAWYWTLIGVRFVAGSSTPTPESAAELAKYQDLDRRYREIGLRRFVTSNDLDLRRCLLPGLHLRQDAYPADMHGLVAQAIEIARSSDDGYLRHRVEIQIG